MKAAGEIALEMADKMLRSAALMPASLPPMMKAH
jgi:hypothetical protein